MLLAFASAGCFLAGVCLVESRLRLARLLLRVGLLARFGALGGVTAVETPGTILAVVSPALLALLAIPMVGPFAHNNYQPPA
jgi:hypothetical protein